MFLWNVFSYIYCTVLYIPEDHNFLFVFKEIYIYIGFYATNWKVAGSRPDEINFS
jgi:hypothetical protein